MPLHEVKLLGAEVVASGTMMFRFEKPAGFVYQPGQAIDVELTDPPPEPRESRRTFSLTSAPFEPHIAVATRMRDASIFKAALKKLPAGSAVRIDGPFGEMTLDPRSTRPAVMVAGGIGITPFRSMALQAQREGVVRPLFLVYSNRRPEDAAFLAELQDIEHEFKAFHLVATMTDMEHSGRPWNGRRGMIDAELLKNVAGTENPVYYLAGPPGMVDAAMQMLGAAGVAKEDIRYEEFFGY